MYDERSLHPNVVGEPRHPTGFGADLAVLEELSRSIGGAEELKRLAALGRVKGGVVHDLNNLLALVLGYANLLLAADLQPGTEGWRRAREIRDAARRAQGMTRELLGREPSNGHVVRSVDPRSVLTGIRSLLDQIVGPEIRLELDLATDTPGVGIDAFHLERAVINLVLNAREAMPDGGSISVCCSHVWLRASDLTSRNQPDRGRLVPGNWALVTVSDSGPGMDAETRKRVLEPFFTTRQNGHGKGLGLATVADLVTGARGALSLTSAPGCGTTAYIWLPAVA